MSGKPSEEIILARASFRSGLLILFVMCSCFLLSKNDTLSGEARTVKTLHAHQNADTVARAGPWEGGQAITNMVMPLIGQIRSKGLTLVNEERLKVTALLTAMTQLEGVEGDLVETGTWNGGSLILMGHVLAILGSQQCVLWAADSFQGLPSRKTEDEGDGNQASKGAMAISRAQFERNLQMFMLSGIASQVRILEGWFSETLPQAPINKIAFLRLDGDLYESTMDVLTALYDKVSIGGYIYVDDYGSFTGCKRAVDEFRSSNNLTEALNMVIEGQNSILFEAIWWKKTM